MQRSRVRFITFHCQEVTRNFVVTGNGKNTDLVAFFSSLVSSFLQKKLARRELYSAQIGLRNSTQPGALWIPAFAGMTVIEFFANYSVWSIAIGDDFTDVTFPPLLALPRQRDFAITQQ